MRHKSTICIAVMVTGIILFAVAMAVRDELPPGWQRAVLAGVGAAVLGMALLLARRNHES